METTPASSKKSQSILVTGATAGIGRHAALHLARAGHHVIATGRKRAALEALAAEARGTRMDVVTLDVDDAASIARAADEALRLTGGRGIDALVNNAGFGLAVPVAETRDADVRAMFETNVFGLLAATRAFLPQLAARRGRVVNVGSTGGKVASPMLGVYTATKHAVEALSDALRWELAPLGVKVALIEPGPIATNFSDRTLGGVEDLHADAASPWAPMYRAFASARATSDRLAADPKVVTRALEKALFRRRPRARYVTPWWAHLMIWSMRLAPTPLLDFLVRRLGGLDAPARLAPPAPTASAETAAA